jgi:predicted house-cleaning noncanonical NTP pyrophosphatase (MazG superfamily)
MNLTLPHLNHDRARRLADTLDKYATDLDECMQEIEDDAEREALADVLIDVEHLIRALRAEAKTEAERYAA